MYVFQYLSNVNFNSRPSARGDPPSHQQNSQHRISIHAPPRGATMRRVSPLAASVFQFTPLREGRRLQQTVVDCRHQFQFTPLREGRLASQVASRIGRSISIHAPPRGATWQPCEKHHRRHHFNSRPSARGDGKRYAISANLLFNPYKSAWLNNSATQFVEIILVIFHRIIV